MVRCRIRFFIFLPVMASSVEHRERESSDYSTRGWFSLWAMIKVRNSSIQRKPSVCGIPACASSHGGEPAILPLRYLTIPQYTGDCMLILWCIYYSQWLFHMQTLECNCATNLLQVGALDKLVSLSSFCKSHEVHELKFSEIITRLCLFYSWGV